MFSKIGNHNSHLSEYDHLEGGSAKIDTKSDHPKSAVKIMPNKEDIERERNKTAKKKSRGNDENRTINVTNIKETQQKSKPKEGKVKSKSRDNSVNKKGDKKDYVSRDSKKSYDFDFGSEDERIAAEKKARDTSKGRRNTSKIMKEVVVTPKKNKSSAPNNKTFTFEEQQYDAREEIADLKDQMKDFELQIISVMRNLKIDMEDRAKLMDEKIAALKTPNENYQAVRKDLDYLKGLNEALEEERKKDMLRAKKYMEEKADQIFKDVENARNLDRKEVDKKLQQTKFEVVEQLIELTDNHKREIREVKYGVDKNKEDIELCQHSIKSLKRRTTEEPDKEETRAAKKSDPQLSSSENYKLDQKIDSKLNKLRNEVTADNEQFTQKLIEHNNIKFVIPTVENALEKAEEISSSRRSHRDSKASLPTYNVSPSDVEEKCMVLINQHCPKIAKNVVENEIKLATREIVENEIEPICKNVMIEEYARSRRNIIEKEIEPVCREIIGEEVPELCEMHFNKGFNQNKMDLLQNELRPV